MQARWGTHGEHNTIVLYAFSVQSAFELGIRAFNLSEKYRVPVILLLDEAVGHTRETVEIADEYEVFNRVNKGETPPFGGRLVPDMPKLGDGEKLMVTGSTHDPRGIRKTSDYTVQKELVTRLNDKIERNRDDIEDFIEIETEDCEFLFLAAGITARSVMAAVKTLRKEGLKAGGVILKTVWPFPQRRIKELSKRVDRIIVPELNFGQLALEAERISKRKVERLNRIDSQPIYPSQLVEKIRGER